MGGAFSKTLAFYGLTRDRSITGDGIGLGVSSISPRYWEKKKIRQALRETSFSSISLSQTHPNIILNRKRPVSLA